MEKRKESVTNKLIQLFNVTVRAKAQYETGRISPGINAGDSQEASKENIRLFALLYKQLLRRYASGDARQPFAIAYASQGATIPAANNSRVQTF